MESYPEQPRNDLRRPPRFELAERQLHKISDRPTYAFQYQIEPSLISGTAAGTSFSATAGCDGACTKDSSKFTTTVAKVGVTITGESYYDWNGTAGTQGTGHPWWNATTATPGTASGPSPYYDYAPYIRCDTIVSTTVGCVLSNIIPFISYDKSVYLTFTAHDSGAQASGLRGSSVSMKPLHRLTDATLIQKNRDTACLKSYPRPTGRSCNEYPFASTKEGASFATAGPRTQVGCAITLTVKQSKGLEGYSVCMINETENVSAGSVLGGRPYTPYRVLDGDSFYVDVDPNA